MDGTSAPNIEDAPPEPARRPFSLVPEPTLFSRIHDRLENFLAAQQSRLALWAVAAFAAGIGLWFSAPDRTLWLGVILLAVAAGVAGLLVGGRTGRALWIGGLLVVAGLGLAWGRANWVAAPRLDRPAMVTLSGRVLAVELRRAEGRMRLLVAPDDPGLPPRVRVSVPTAADAAPAITSGSVVTMRARLQPPPPMALPGTHDFARDLWFQGIGAVGSSVGAVQLRVRAPPPPMEAMRTALSRTIADRLDPAAAGIAQALATGDQGAIGRGDAEAMRRSGLAHLLSVSGLHIAAVIGATMLLVLRLGALWPWAALRVNMVLVSAAAGAGAGLFYTVLTGMQVPTVRSCIGALLVLLGLALGRPALSLRLVAVAALAILLVRPEALVGASFQMSFAAVAAIVALGEAGWMRRLRAPREEPWWQWLGRRTLDLVLTGLAVELALIPLGLYHFHKSGLYGVVANLFAIPWTTFVVMPLEGLALVGEGLGVGAVIWPLVGWSVDRILAVAHYFAGLQGAVIVHPAVAPGALALAVLAGLWLIVWRGPVRRWAALPALLAIAIGLAEPRPDLLVTGDGRHVAIVDGDGVPALLRERSGDYVQSLLSERAAHDGPPGFVAALPGARCSPDSCIADVTRDGRSWRILAMRSRYLLDWKAMIAACRDADIVIADRRLPGACTPRWLRLDRPALARSGGLAIRLGSRPTVASVGDAVGAHPWAAYRD